MKYFVSVMITFAVLLGTANIKTKNKKVGQNFFQKRLERLGKGFVTIPLPNGKVMSLGLSKNAVAEESACDQVLAAVDEGIPQYTAGSLGVFNRALYYLNNRNAADVENVFCHFVNSMGMTGEVGTATETFDGTTVTVTVSEPLDAWASTAGYTKKGEVIVRTAGSEADENYMTIYWGFGEGSTDTTKTKGFLIEGSPLSLGGPRAGYMQWDLTGATQTGRFYAVEFPSIEGEESPDNTTPENYFLKSSSAAYESDYVAYGRFSLDTSNNTVHIQGLQIEGERKQEESPAAYGCYKIFGIGTKGDMMVIAKTRNKHDSEDGAEGFGFAQLGHFTGGTSSAVAQAKDFSNMDAACLPDLTTTPNLEGNMNDPGVSTNQWAQNIVDAIKENSSNSGVATTTNIFDISCEDLNNLSGSGKAFDNANGIAWVDFESSPSDVFGAAATDLAAPSAEELCNFNKCYCP